MPGTQPTCLLLDIIRHALVILETNMEELMIHSQLCREGAVEYFCICFVTPASDAKCWHFFFSPFICACVCGYAHVCFKRCHVSRHAPIKTLISQQYKQTAYVSVRRLNSVEHDDQRRTAGRNKTNTGTLNMKHLFLKITFVVI